MSEAGQIVTPRYPVCCASAEAVDRALQRTGFVVIEKVWRPEYLRALRQPIMQHFDTVTDRYEGKLQHSAPSDVQVYLGSSYGLGHLEPTTGAESHDDAWQRELIASGLLRLLYVLMNGPVFVGRSERVIRRVEPTKPLRAVGLHCDGQLHLCSEQGVHTQRELTCWTPLQDCLDEQTPRLLLLERGQTYMDLFDTSDYCHALGTPFLPVQLKPASFTDEAKVAHLPAVMWAQYQRIFLETRWAAPRVPLGDVVLFEPDIWHGTYLTKDMTTTRYSFDFRCCGAFRRTKENWKYDGVLYDQQGHVCLEEPVGAPS